MHAVSEQLNAVHFHVANVVRWLGRLHRLIVQCGVLVYSCRSLPDATPQVEMNSLKKALPSVSKRQCPVIAVQGDIQFGPLPVRVSMLTYRHGPAL